MKKPAPNRIAEERKSCGLSQQELGDLVGAHWVTISKLERGKIKLTTNWIEKIAAALQLNETDLLRRTKSIAKALVVGGIGEDGIAIIYPKPQWTETSVKNSHFNDPDGFWLAVESRFYSPVLHPSDFIYLIPMGAELLRKPLRGNLELVTGRLALVELKKGRGALGFLYPGSKPGQWDMYWFDRRILHDEKPKRISMVCATINTYAEASPEDVHNSQKPSWLSPY